MTGAPTPKSGTITAAICTRARPEMLLRALGSVLAQSRRADEVLVIDNLAGDDALAAAVARLDPSVRVIPEPREGLDFARNRALGEATSAWIIFIDDDVVLDERAVERLAAHTRGDAGTNAGTDAGVPRARARRSRVRRGEEPRARVVNGRVLPLSLEHAGQRLFERNAGFDRGSAPRVLERGRLVPWRSSPIHGVVSIGSGCCMAVHRATALALGGFDEALDLGAALGGGGDLDLYWRAVQAGARVLYDPSLLARHEHRRETAAAVRQICQHNAGLIVFLSKAAGQGPWPDRMMARAFLAWRLLKPCLRYVRALIGVDALEPGQAAALVRATWTALGRYGALRRLATARATT